MVQRGGTELRANLHDYVVERAGALADLAEERYADALVAGRTEVAGRWAAMLEALCQAVRTVDPVLHGPEGMGPARLTSGRGEGVRT